MLGQNFSILIIYWLLCLPKLMMIDLMTKKNYLSEYLQLLYLISLSIYYQYKK